MNSIGGIGQEEKGQAVSFREFMVAFFGITTDSNHFGAMGFKILVMISKTTYFSRTSGGVIFGIEKKD